MIRGNSAMRSLAILVPLNLLLWYAICHACMLALTAVLAS
jgi:hypothetical protein